MSALSRAKASRNKKGGSEYVCSDSGMDASAD
jgi:hypothetical protein